MPCGKLVGRDLVCRNKAHAGMRGAQEKLAIDREGNLARVAPVANARYHIAPVRKSKSVERNDEMLCLAPQKGR